MIEVNGFWLGVWVASTVILVLLIGIAMFAGRHSGSEQEIDISPEGPMKLVARWVPC